MSESLDPRRARASVPSADDGTTPDGPRSAADIGAEVPRDGMRWWARLVLVLAFEAAAALALWWALNPDASSSTANPGTVPTFLAVVVLVLFVLVAVQASARVPLWVWATVALLVVPALVAGARGLDGVALLGAERVRATNVRDGQELFNGMTRYTATLPDGRDVPVYSVSAGKGRVLMSSRARNADKSLLQLARRPYARPGQSQDVVVGGPTFARFAYGDDLSSADRTRNWIWAGAGLVLWLPIQATAVSALLRRRAWWSRLGDKDVVPG